MVLYFSLSLFIKVINRFFQFYLQNLPWVHLLALFHYYPWLHIAMCLHPAYCSSILCAISALPPAQLETYRRSYHLSLAWPEAEGIIWRCPQKLPHGLGGLFLLFLPQRNDSLDTALFAPDFTFTYHRNYIQIKQSWRGQITKCICSGG